MGLYGEYHGPADERDLQLVAQRQFNRDNMYANSTDPLEGDVVLYPDGTRHRISHVIYHHDDNGERVGVEAIQTSKGGSFHFCDNGHISFSGSLFSPIPAGGLHTYGKYAVESAWIFHHGLMSAHRSVSIPVLVRVWHTPAQVPAS